MMELVPCVFSYTPLVRQFNYDMGGGLNCAPQRLDKIDTAVFVLLR